MKLNNRRIWSLDLKSEVKYYTKGNVKAQIEDSISCHRTRKLIDIFLEEKITNGADSNLEAIRYLHV